MCVFVLCVLAILFCCFESSFSPMCYVELYVFFLAHAGRTRFELPPRMTYRRVSDARSNVQVTHTVFTKNCVAAVSNP